MLNFIVDKVIPAKSTFITHLSHKRKVLLLFIAMNVWAGCFHKDTVYFMKQTTSICMYKSVFRFLNPMNSINEGLEEGTWWWVDNVSVVNCVGILDCVSNVHCVDDSNCGDDVDCVNDDSSVVNADCDVNIDPVDEVDCVDVVDCAGYVNCVSVADRRGNV